jgi:hypothetical protein
MSDDYMIGREWRFIIHLKHKSTVAITANASAATSAIRYDVVFGYRLQKKRKRFVSREEGTSLYVVLQAGPEVLLVWR